MAYQDLNGQPTISWRTMRKAKAFTPETKRCNLCLAEKFEIVNYPGVQMSRQKNFWRQYSGGGATLRICDIFHGTQPHVVRLKVERILSGFDRMLNFKVALFLLVFASNRLVVVYHFAQNFMLFSMITFISFEFNFWKTSLFYQFFCPFFFCSVSKQLVFLVEEL